MTAPMTDHLSSVTGGPGEVSPPRHDTTAPVSPQVMTHVTGEPDLFTSAGMTVVTGVPRSEHIHARMRAHAAAATCPDLSPVIPWWAQAYETRTGGELRLTSGKAIPARCDRCGAWTLHGYDAPLMAGLAVVDPNPLTPVLEAAAVVLDLPTYQLWGAPGRWSLTPRHEPGVRRIGTARPAGDVIALAAHTCRPPLSSAHLRMTARTPARTDQPPF